MSNDPDTQFEPVYGMERFRKINLVKSFLTEHMPDDVDRGAISSEVMLWTDGDFQVSVFHSKQDFDDDDNKITRRDKISYQWSDDLVRVYDLYYENPISKAGHIDKYDVMDVSFREDE